MPIVLSNRLGKIASLVPRGSRVADIGTDHGLLPAFLLQEGICTHAIASDVREKPLSKARATAQQWGIDNIEFRLCDGLSGIGAEETDVAVIAGMGGDTIGQIIEASSWAVKGGRLLILQPMSSVEDLRRKLYALHLAIVRETLAEEESGIYCVMAVSGTDEREKEPWQEYASEALAADGCALFPAYLKKLIFSLERAYNGAKASKKEIDGPRAEHFRLALEGLRRLTEEIK